MNQMPRYEPSPEEVRAEAAKIKAENNEKEKVRQVRPHHAHAPKIVHRSPISRSRRADG